MQHGCFFCARFVKMKFNAGGFALKNEYRTRIFVLTDNVQGTLILNKTPFDSVPEHVCTDICSTQFVYEPWGTEYPSETMTGKPCPMRIEMRFFHF